MRYLSICLGLVFANSILAKEPVKNEWIDVGPSTGENAPYILSEPKKSLAREICENDYEVLEKTQYILIEKLEQIKIKIDHLEKQQRDFLSLISDIVMKPSYPAAPQEHVDYQTNLDFMKAQQYSQVLKLWKKFIQDYPSSEKIPYAYYWMGELYSSDGQPESAKECYQYVIDQYPAHVKASEAFFKIGHLEMRQGHKEKAIFLYKTVVKQYPLSHVAYMSKKILGEIAPEEINYLM